MFAYIWPVALVVLSNTVYHICSKTVSDGMDPFASLVVTYLVGAAVAAGLFFLTNRNGNLLRQWKNANWSTVVLGIAIVGLEVGFLFAYRAGWQISMANIVQSSALAVLLLFVGRLLFHESLTWNKIAGVIVCLAGLALVNLK